MAKPRGLWVWIFLCCWLASGAAGTAWAKKARPRIAKPEKKVEAKAKKKADNKKKKGQKAAPEPTVAPAAAATKPPGIEDPKTLWSLAEKQEKGGDVSGCLKTLAKFVNVYPGHPERAATLKRMAELAQTQGETDKALQLYAMLAFLYPGSQAAAAARWQVHNLEFFRNLRERDPLASFRDYLQKVNSQYPEVAPDQLREPLRQGWQAVARVLRRSSPCPVHLVEEALALWEMHPQGTQPPEAALILGELLQENGLCGEARKYLEQARDQGTPAVRTRALVGLLERAWASRDLGDFAGAWSLWRREKGEVTGELKSRLDKLPLPQGFFSKASGEDRDQKADGDVVAALLEWWSGKAPETSRQGDLFRCLEHFLSRPLPPAVRERLLLQLAQMQWSQGHYPQAARVYEHLLAANAKGENSAFYWDRLALSQLQDQRPDAALKIYRDLSQKGDSFWQLVSRTRLADVELKRMQTEPPQ